MAKPIDAALKRFEAALDLLEGAIEGRLEGALQAADLENELQRLGTSRSQLAQSLDAAEGRNAQLEETGREISQRLDMAMQTIRTVLDRKGA